MEDADEWRPEAWEMMRLRQDLHFLFITKRIDRLKDCLPSDWGEGYDNVTICCTMENQDRIDYRLPIYKAAPIKHKIIICEPLLSRIDFRGELGEWVEQVVAGGESGREARVCDYDWVLEIRRQCIEANVGFWFKQTGSYLLKEGKEFKVARQFQHSQARKAEINYEPDRTSFISPTNDFGKSTTFFRLRCSVFFINCSIFHKSAGKAKKTALRFIDSNSLSLNSFSPIHRQSNKKIRE